MLPPQTKTSQNVCFYFFYVWGIEQTNRYGQQVKKVLGLISSWSKAEWSAEDRHIKGATNNWRSKGSSEQREVPTFICLLKLSINYRMSSETGPDCASRSIALARCKRRNVSLVMAQFRISGSWLPPIHCSNTPMASLCLSITCVR